MTKQSHPSKPTTPILYADWKQVALLLRKEGMTLAQIGKVVGRHEVTVHLALKRMTAKPANETRPMTYAEMSLEFGISLDYARNLTFNNNWSRAIGDDGLARISVPLEEIQRRAPHLLKPAPVDWVEEARRLRSEGKTFREVSERVGRSIQTVHMALKRTEARQKWAAIAAQNARSEARA